MLTSAFSTLHHWIGSALDNAECDIFISTNLNDGADGRLQTARMLMDGSLEVTYDDLDAAPRIGRGAKSVLIRPGMDHCFVRDEGIWYTANGESGLIYFGYQTAAVFNPLPQTELQQDFWLINGRAPQDNRIAV